CDACDLALTRGQSTDDAQLARDVGAGLRALAAADQRNAPRAPALVGGGEEEIEWRRLKLARGKRTCDLAAGRVVQPIEAGRRVFLEPRNDDEVGLHDRQRTSSTTDRRV